jgi:hypothetical protein
LWSDRPEVPCDRIVASALSGFWLGLDPVCRGEVWAR